MSPKFLKYYKILCILTFLLIPLGGSVRAMNAGLSCPDWPLCFGDVIPDYHPEVYFEFMHRVWAGFVGILTVILNIKVIRTKSLSLQIRWIAGFAIVLLLAQVLMGGLTVLLQLHEEVVTTHLALGTGFFATLLWIYLSLTMTSWQNTNSPIWLKPFAKLTAASVYIQILLGGFVASHYAALVCIDFPTCHGQWIPTFRGIIGLQVIHRLGAYALAVIVLAFGILLLKRILCSQVRNFAWWMMALIGIQICLGIANVLLLTPPLITVLHLATGTALLGFAVATARRVTL